MIVCSNVTKSFFPSGRGLADVSLSVARGEAYALLGSNGAGKTTLLNLLLGHLRPDAGSVRVAGLDVQEDPVGVKRKVAYVPEVAALYGRLTALENLRFFDALLGHRRSDDDYLATLSRLGFSGLQTSDAVGSYSKGMRQKVALAIGLLKGAEVFLLDEPFSGLDPESRDELAATIVSLRDEGKCIVVTSHDPDGISATASRVGVLADGRLTIDEPVAQFRKRDAKTIYRRPSSDPD